MKYIKSYNQLLESIRDQMKPKDDEDILSALSKLNIYDRIMKIKSDGLDDKFLPSDDEIKEYLADWEDSIYDKLVSINKLGLDDKFKPSDDEIKEYLSSLDIEDWLNTVDVLKLDRSEFDPPQEKVLEYILPSSIKYNSENSTLEFSEWSDFADLFQEHRDVRDRYIENVLSGMGYEYFDYYDTIEPDYFEFDDKKIFQEVKKEIKEKIYELDLSEEDEYDEMIKDFDSVESFRDLYDKVLEEYDILEDIKTAIDLAYTTSQELADEAEAYNSLTDSIIKTFNGGEVKYENDKYVLPITNPNFNAEDVVDNGRVIEWELPYYGWNGDVDDDTFLQEIENKLEDI